MTIFASDFTTVAFYQACECFYGCCAYLGTTVAILTDVITDFLVPAIILVTEFTYLCPYLCYCLPKGYQYPLFAVNIRTRQKCSVLLTFSVLLCLSEPYVCFPLRYFDRF
jgi:hypothetical protein